MNLNDNIRIYYQPTASDLAGGRTDDGDPELVAQVWGNVKPMNAYLSMQFQQIAGTQGFEIVIRTDFERELNKKYYIEVEGIYGDMRFWIHNIEVYKNRTKLICTGENRLKK